MLNSPEGLVVPILNIFTTAESSTGQRHTRRVSKTLPGLGGRVSIVRKGRKDIIGPFHSKKSDGGSRWSGVPTHKIHVY
jgi:hypothetical protein